MSLVLPNVAVFPCFFANSGGRLSGPNGPVDTFWICSVASVAGGGVFLCVFVRGFSIKGAKWLCYLGGVGCTLFIFIRGFSAKVAELNMNKKDQTIFVRGFSTKVQVFQARNRWMSEWSGCDMCELWRPCCGQKQMVVRVVWVYHLRALAALLWPETDGSPSCPGVSFASSGGPVIARNRW